MVRIRRDIVPRFRLGESAEEDILAALRGFCLLILEKHAAGIPACRQAGRQKKTARILYPALFCFDLSEIYELCELKAFFLLIDLPVFLSRFHCFYYEP